MLAACCLLASACQTAQQHIDELALEAHLQRTVLTSRSGFKHVVYSSNLAAKNGHLHVYLEGDGSPWLRPNLISMDPTPRRALALQLMALDPMPSIYLGRPCYHGYQQQALCSPLLWTHARYSETVVQSMADVLNQLREIYSAQQIEFIGYSGGGVLAMLLAEAVPDTRQVVTIAANLDIDAWADHHHYTRLQDSLNPSQRLDNTKQLQQYHLFGLEDKTVPAYITQQLASGNKNKAATFMAFREYDHRCCWVKAWPELLRQLDLLEKPNAD